MDRKILIAASAAMMLSACQPSDGGNDAMANGTAPDGQVTAQSGDTKNPPKTAIFAAATQTADLSVLVRAIKAAGLEQALADPGPYTVFAPTDAAFKKLAPGTADAWMQPDRKAQLTGIITYHLVPGVVTAADLRSAMERGDGKTQLATISGGTLALSRDGNAIVVTDGGGGKARVTEADLTQSNGVIHKIDTVLVPR